MKQYSLTHFSTIACTTQLCNQVTFHHHAKREIIMITTIGTHIICRSIRSSQIPSQCSDKLNNSKSTSMYLTAGDDIEMLSQNINEFAFTLITPLTPQHAGDLAQSVDSTQSIPSLLSHGNRVGRFHRRTFDGCCSPGAGRNAPRTAVGRNPV